jgi:hypothetical protein
MQKSYIKNKNIARNILIHKVFKKQEILNRILVNPNKTRKQVVEIALHKFRDEQGSMTEYIRSYSVFIQKTGELLRKSNDPTSVFKSIIEKSKYT